MTFPPDNITNRMLNYSSLGCFLLMYLFIGLGAGCSTTQPPKADSIVPVKHSIVINSDIAAPRNYFVYTNGCVEYFTNGVLAWTKCNQSAYGQCAITAYFSVPDNILTLEPDAGPPNSVMGKSAYENHVWTLQAVRSLGDPWQDMVSVTNNLSAETFLMTNATLPTVSYRVKYQ